ncbi:uncharacterized protein PG998_008737 [Apiospora kogelbergensis]|uniref:uncharacterized protein n=1 Tax=Apiospora kogelbergensis TaxID=1337665 RepID=UPI0031321200
MHTSNPTLATVAVALLSALPTVSAGIYTKNSPVLQVDAKSYDRLVAKSNYTTVLEFYAPWCGHCQNLKPAYEKAAKNLDGLAQVAAVNCDEDENKAFCGQFGVQGFPTLKIARPGKKAGGKPVVEDYNGPRSAKGIVDAVVDKINNHVQRVTDKDLDGFLSTRNDSAKAILFTEKGTTGALLKSLAIDFLDVIQVAQIRNKEAKANALFGVASYPALVLLPGGDKPGLLYDGEMKKDAMVKFLSQAGAPNPVSGPAKPKAKKEKKEKASSKSSDAKSKTKEAAKEETTASTETPKATKAAEAAPAIPAITEPSKLIKECLNPKSGTCILAVVPSAHGETAEKALGSLSELAHKHAEAKRHLFPFYEIHSADANVAALVKSLEITKEVEIVAVNGKRKWWRQYEGDLSSESIESWIDAIRLSEGTKKKLPAGVLSEVAEETPQAEKVEVKIEDEIKVKVPTESGVHLVAGRRAYARGHGRGA